jgi:opacity protein-like surface antigen
MEFLTRCASLRLPRVVPCVVLLLLTFTAHPAFALYEHIRSGWVAGIGYGWAKAEITTGDSLHLESLWEDGSTPHLRLGHMLGRHTMLGYEQFQWVHEEGAGDAVVRVSLQTFGAAITVFPGDPKHTTGGIYLRAGAGLVNARVAFGKLPSEADSTHHEETVDEGGTAFMVGGGYEFRISKPAALAFDVTANYHTVGKDFFDKAWFIPLTLGLNWYF